MIKKIIILFKLARKIALSDALNVISKIQKPPLIINFFFSIFFISFKKDDQFQNFSYEEMLCASIQNMGTTFIKLGQFLATRPDIIGKFIKLEKLQDKLSFS